MTTIEKYNVLFLSRCGNSKCPHAHEEIVKDSMCKNAIKGLKNSTVFNCCDTWLAKSGRIDCDYIASKDKELFQRYIKKNHNKGVDYLMGDGKDANDVVNVLDDSDFPINILDETDSDSETHTLTKNQKKNRRRNQNKNRRRQNKKKSL